jgi:hypothetical protein
VFAYKSPCGTGSQKKGEGMEQRGVTSEFDFSEATSAQEVKAKTTVAIIPAFNEERFIASVVMGTLPFVDHVVVIDDGSSDHTAEFARAAGALVFRQPHNAGKAAALNAGFREALRYHPDVVVCLDGDAQHDPADIPKLIKPVLEGLVDVVIGSRFLSVKSDIPRWRQVGQRTLTVVTNTLSGVPITDSQSGFRAFSPTALAALKFKSSGLSLESEMQFYFEKAKLRLAEVPISVKYTDGNKRNPVIHGLQVLDAMLSLVARRRPLLFISLPGLLLSTLGLLLGVYVTLHIEHTGQLLTGTAMLTVLFTIGGLLLAMSGVLLHSLGHFTGRLRDEIKDLIEHPEPTLATVSILPAGALPMSVEPTKVS